MRASNSDNCWPTIHGPQDWEEVMLDPATTEAGSFHPLHRLMEPQVHRQFVLEQARRFSEAGWVVFYCVLSYHRAVEVVQGLVDDAKASGQEPVVFGEDPLMYAATVTRHKDYGPDFEFPGDGYAAVGDAIATGGKKVKLAEILRLAEEQAPGKPVVLMYETAALSKLEINTEGAQPPLLRPAVLALTPAVVSATLQSCPYCGGPVGVNLRPQRGLSRECQRQAQHRKAGKPLIWREPACVPVKRPGSQVKLTTRRGWSDADSELAFTLRKQGLTYAAIGEQLRRSKRAIRSHIRSGGNQGTRARQATRKILEGYQAEYTRKCLAEIEEMQQNNPQLVLT